LLAFRGVLANGSLSSTVEVRCFLFSVGASHADLIKWMGTLHTRSTKSV